MVLSFAGGIVADSWAAYSEGVPGASLLDDEFWSFATEILGMGEIWKEYTTDILIATLFAALGTGSLVKDLLSTKTEA